MSLFDHIRGHDYSVKHNGKMQTLKNLENFKGF